MQRSAQRFVLVQICSVQGGQAASTAAELHERTLERNAHMQSIELGHDRVEVRFLVVGPDNGIPLVITPGGQSSGIDSMVVGAEAASAQTLSKGTRVVSAQTLSKGARAYTAGWQEAPATKDAECLVLARNLAQEGFRVLLHDRVNTGGSSFYLGRRRDSESADDIAGSSQVGRSAEYRGHGEPRLQAFFLRELMVATGFSRAFLWGNSAGSRLSCHLASMYPEHALGLILFNITSGPRAASALANSYYTQYIPAAEVATSDEDHSGVSLEKLTRHDLYFGLVARRSANAEAICATSAVEFAETLGTWADFLLAGNGEPIVGARADMLANIKCSAFVVFDHVDDGFHTPQASRALASALGNCKECVVGQRAAVWFPRVLAFVRSCQ